MKNLVPFFLLLLLSTRSFAIAPITGKTNICTISSFTTALTDATPGGTWTSSNTTVATVDVSTGLVTGHLTGTSTISYTVGGSYATTTVNVFYRLPFITGPGTVLVGGLVALSDPISGGKWSAYKPLGADVDSVTGIVTGISPSSFDTIVYSTGPSCYAYKGMMVTAGPPCTGTPVGGTAHANYSFVCSSTLLTLSLTGYTIATGVSFQWQYSPDTITWYNLSGGILQTFSFYASATYYYRCVLTCSTSGLTANSTMVKVPFTHDLTGLVINPPDIACNAVDFYVATCGVSSSYNVTTFYGDGTKDNWPLTTTATCHADILHTYANAGTYSIMQILYNGTSPEDTVKFSYNYSYCRRLLVQLYNDNNFNCIYDPLETNYAPIEMEVDSEGVFIDSFSVTNGFYYNVTGPPGTVYSFKVLPGNRYISCPSSGILYDTIQSYINNYPVKYIGLGCTTGTSFDLSVNAAVFSYLDCQAGIVLVSNNYCYPTNGTVTIQFSPKYVFANVGALNAKLFPIVVPSSVSGNTVTCDLTGLSTPQSGPIHIFYDLGYNPLTGHLSIWDTTHSYFQVTPITGDVNILNNTEATIDTVKTAIDPNHIGVFPIGCLPTGTNQLKYTISFENTGNDTAHNIHVLDTLSPYLDPHTLSIVVASAEMNIAQYNDGGYNVVKFDFPNINLLDSTHHGQCEGAVVFNLNTISGITDGDTIYNRAGIYFDINPVVMTNTAENIVGCPLSVAGVNKQDDVAIYPNPVADELTIKIVKGAYRSCSVFNSLGQVVLQQDLSTITKLDTKTLPAGLYYVRLTGDNGVSTHKFVKM